MRLIDADAFRRELDNHWPFTKEEQSKHGIADLAKGTVLTVLGQMPTIEPEPKWIPCSERLPYKPIRVQAQLDNWWIVTAYYDDAWHTVPDIGQELKNDEVIAWMPLPKPWEGEQP